MKDQNHNRQSCANISNHLNDIVMPYLKNYEAGIYVLDKEGCEIVTKANENLGKDYSELLDYHIDDHWYNIIKNKLNQMPPREYNLVLDVCCGSGFICLNIMKKGLFKKCYAVDVSESQIVFLKNKILELKINSVTPIRDDVLNTKFANDTFDCVVGNSFLHHLPDNYLFLKEMIRVLKTGGVLCLTHEPSTSATYLEGYITKKLKNIVNTLNIGREKDQSRKVIFTDIWQYNEKDTIQMIKDCGFNECKIFATGRIATIVGRFVNKVWWRLFQKIPPIAIHKITSALLFLDKVVYKGCNKDTFSSFTILARK